MIAETISADATIDAWMRQFTRAYCVFELKYVSWKLSIMRPAEAGASGDSNIRIPVRQALMRILESKDH
jgi:hypothetical protein